MAGLLSWSIYDGNGAPMTGAVPVFVDYSDRIGVPRTQPTIVELGGGLYGFVPTDPDEAVGVVYLVDNGVTASPRRVSGAVSTDAAPFSAWHLEDDAAALWVGAAPTIGAYASIAGPRSAPFVTAVRSYLFALSPGTDDLDVGVTFRADSPAGAWPLFVQDSLKAGVRLALSTGTLKNAAFDIVQFLDGKAAGGVDLAKSVNLFVGQMRSSVRTPAPAVFVLNTGGAAPEPYFGAERSALYRPTVQVMVRGPAGNDEAGEELARGVLAWLNQRIVSGYVSWYTRDSAPAFLGSDSNQHGQWSINVECQYKTSLG